MALGVALTILSGAGTVVSGFAGRDSARAQAGQLDERARLLLEQADEVLRRAKINVRASQTEGQKLKARQQTAFAANNVALGFGAPLDVLIETERMVIQEVGNIRTEANFRAKQLRSEAAGLKKSADDLREAGDLNLLGSLAIGGLSIAAAGGAFDPPSTPDELFAADAASFDAAVEEFTVGLQDLPRFEPLPSGIIADPSGLARIGGN